MFLLASVDYAAGQAAPGTSRLSTAADRESDLQRAQRYERRGNYVEALSMYLEMMKSPEVRQPAYNGALRVYLTLERWEELGDFLRERVGESPGDVDAHLFLGLSLARQGQTSEAAKVWDRAASLTSGRADVLEKVARFAREAGMVDTAVAFFLKARGERKVKALYAMDLSALYLKGAKTGEAVRELLGWLEANPQQEAIVQGEFRRILWDPEHQDVARRVLLEEVRRRPGWMELGRTMISLLVELGECDEALELAELTRKAASPPVVSLVALGDQFQESGCVDTAVKAYRLAAAGVPGDRKASLVRLGRLWVKQGRDLEAAQEFRRFLQEFPGSADARATRFDLGGVLLRLGQPEEALAELWVLKGTIPGKSGDLEVRFLMAECLIGLGRLDEAAEELESMPLGGSSVAKEEYLYRRGEILFLAGRFDDALESFQSVISGFPEGRFVNDSVSRILLISGNRAAGEDALSLYASALYSERLGQWPRAL
ncbi:MAG: tetratricopeptide repeat protein, partial [Candidatus Eisenbacteria sp.]|nr:tetratricopeptide repeat protein [Candidatus Eisenbacteria bacterium]